MKSTYRLLLVTAISLTLMLGALQLLAAPDEVLRPAIQSTPVTASATIQPGTAQTMGDTDVTLTFAPGASGEVTVTLVPTTPVNPPPGGATTRSWFINTTAEDYTVRATFGYSQLTPVDVVVAFDSSGPMEYDTLCYGCWTPASTQEYPAGDRWPLPWNGPADGPPAHCAGSEPQTKTIGSDYTFALLEAEEYGRSSNPYNRNMYTPGITYWVMQRNGHITEPHTDYLGDAGAYGRDARGAYIGHFPYRTGFDGEPGAGGVPCVWEDINDGFMCRRGDWITQRGGPFPAPRVDYEFVVPTDPSGGDTWYFWIRAQGGDPTSDPNDGQGVFWGLDGVLLGRGAQNHATGDNHFKYNGANPDYWTWRRLQKGATGDAGNGNDLTPGASHILNIWAGSTGFTIDQIVITNYSGDISDATLTGIAHDNNRTNRACEPCDARFGGYPGAPGDNQPPHCVLPGFPVDHPSNYRYLDDIYDDEQGLAGAAASTVRFIRAMDIAQHQIGLIRYSSVADTVSELTCLKSDGAACDANAIENALVDPLLNRSQTYAHGSINIPDAIEESIRILSSDSPHYGRSGALPVIILMSNRPPDTYNNLDAANADCAAGNSYPGGTAAQKCAMFMALRAREQGILIHTLSMGPGADQPLMQAIANVTGGLHYYAPDIKIMDITFTTLQSQLAAAPMRALYQRTSADVPWQMYPLTLTEAAPFAVTGKDITTFSEWTLGPLPILMKAQPGTLVAGGVVTSTVVATVLQGYYHSELRPAADGPITFATSLGTITPVTTLTVDGIATAVLVPGLDVGQAIITATNGEMTGVVTIEIALNIPAAITLVAEENTLLANGQSTSVITATVTNPGNYPVEDGTPVTFTTTLGEIAPMFATTANGEVTTTLTAGMEVGVATVGVTAGDVTGSLDVAFVSPAPYTITVVAQPIALLADGQSTSTITATVTNAGGYPVEDGTPVTFTTTLGEVAPTVAATANGVVTTTLTAGMQIGIATVSVTAGDASGTVAVAFGSLAPHAITVTAQPITLPADGQSTATITATVTNVGGYPVDDGTPVMFTTTLGEVAPTIVTTANGVATTTLTAGVEVGVATVSAASGAVTGMAEVSFDPLAPYTITVTAQPTALPADGQSTATITATITDMYARPVMDGTPVTLTASLGTLALGSGTAEIPLRGYTQAGLITATFTAAFTPGRAHVEVTAEQIQGRVWLDIYTQVFLPLVLRH